MQVALSNLIAAQLQRAQAQSAAQRAAGQAPSVEGSKPAFAAELKAQSPSTDSFQPLFTPKTDAPVQTAAPAQPESGRNARMGLVLDVKI